MQAEWAGWPVLVRWQLERTMYDFKNSFSPAFVYIHRAKYIFSRDMFCLPHFWAKIHGVVTNLKLWQLVTLQPFYLQRSTVPIWKDLDQIVKKRFCLRNWQHLKIGFTLWKRPHLHRAYSVIGRHSSCIVISQSSNSLMFSLVSISLGKNP